jgi:CheY-like chemotaxis protein
MNKPCRILVVEDEAIIARDIMLQLQDLGYTALGPAASGERAIEILAELDADAQPALILMDVHLDGAMDGITAAQLIRQRFALRSLFLSAFDGPDSMKRAKLCEPAGFLVKPFEDHALRQALTDALAGQV